MLLSGLHAGQTQCQAEALATLSTEISPAQASSLIQLISQSSHIGDSFIGILI